MAGDAPAAGPAGLADGIGTAGDGKTPGGWHAPGDPRATGNEPAPGNGESASYPRSSSAARSANMRANRRTDTKPELALRRALHRQGVRYRKDYRLDLAGGTRVRPDIAFTAKRLAVFVDGCFWHACPEHGTRPSVNVWYWDPKLRRNVERDRAADAALSAAGWQVIRIWEHEPLDSAIAVVLDALARSRPISGP